MQIKLCLLLFAPFWLACQPNGSDQFGVNPAPIAYNDEAPLSKKSFCNTANCDNPYSEEHYLYNSAGKLTRVNYFYQVSPGKLELSGYAEQIYDQTGLLIRKIRYGKHGSLTGWVAYDESDYEYANGVLKTERTYFNQHNPDKKIVTGVITYEFRDGKKTGQKWYDAQNNLSHQVAYGYVNNVLNRETWLGNKDNVTRIFQHTFAGYRRQIGEYMPNSSEQVALIEKSYDAEGRLSTQETKVSNPLLCIMTPGMIRYSY